MALTMLKVLFQSTALASWGFCNSLCLQSNYFTVVPCKRVEVHNSFVACAWLTTTHDEYRCHGITARLLMCMYFIHIHTYINFIQIFILCFAQIFRLRGVGVAYSSKLLCDPNRCVYLRFLLLKCSCRTMVENVQFHVEPVRKLPIHLWCLKVFHISRGSLAIATCDCVLRDE